LAPWRGAGQVGLAALFVFSLLTTIYLFYVGVRGELVGLMLWPAAVVHAGLTVILARVRFSN
jgi:hypothetical protein